MLDWICGRINATNTFGAIFVFGEYKHIYDFHKLFTRRKTRIVFFFFLNFIFDIWTSMWLYIPYKLDVHEGEISMIER